MPSTRSAVACCLTLTYSSLPFTLTLTLPSLLTHQALYAFYEICGRLTDDVRGLGIGSLNEHLIGKFKASE